MGLMNLQSCFFTTSNSCYFVTNFDSFYYLKSVQIRSFLWSVFCCIRTEYGDLRSKSLQLVRIQENKDRKKTPCLDTFYAVFDHLPPKDSLLTTSDFERSWVLLLPILHVRIKMIEVFLRPFLTISEGDFQQNLGHLLLPFKSILSPDAKQKEGVLTK